MSSLNRALAPLSQAAWNAIDEEAADVLKVTLAGRKLVDFKGPLGWETSAVDTGRVEETGCKPGANVSVRRRRVHPLVEFRREFEISRSEMEALDRGAGDPDLDPVVDAARSLAAAEDEAIFNGFADIGIDGILPSATHRPGGLDPAAVWRRRPLCDRPRPGLLYRAQRNDRQRLSGAKPCRKTSRSCARIRADD